MIEGFFFGRLVISKYDAANEDFLNVYRIQKARTSLRFRSYIDIELTGTRDGMLFCTYY